MLSLDYIIKNSGDSSLESYKYSEGVLILIINLNDIDNRILIKIKTDSMSFNNSFLYNEKELYRTCRIEIQELSNALQIENGIYVPSKLFGKLMNEKRLNFHLAYGEKNNNVNYIFSLVGYERLVSCLISDLSCISFEEIN